VIRSQYAHQAFFTVENRQAAELLLLHDSSGIDQAGIIEAVLTLDKGTSRIVQGPSAQTVLVEVERFEGLPPPVTAFVPPVIE
jgi:hypothetical protein